MMNRTIRGILEAVRDGTVTPQQRQMAGHLVAKEDRREAAAAARACTTTKVAKAAIASVEHHEKARRAEERQAEEVSIATWDLCLVRATVDHRGRCACEACHRPRTLEPHHLELGAGGRRDAPEVVMALCSDCHRLGRDSAHRRPRFFVQTVVIPWLDAHGYPHPNRKEYRA